MCRDCGYVVKCKNCNISLTYHRNKNILKCHYCGYEEPILKLCPECNSKNIKYFGTGTQKLEEQVKKNFPEASTIRMDVDTVTKKNSHEDILNKFKNNNIDILIGTQMVVKGHHFPNVTLVGVIAADSSLNIDSYKANETTFDLLVQVAGRAGREKDKGKVIIQTYNPDSFAIDYAKKQDYKLFYDAEINLRRLLKYPPFCDIIMVGITGAHETEVKQVANLFYKNINKEDRKGLKEKYNLNPITNFTIEVIDSNYTLVNDKFIFSYFQYDKDLIDFNGTISSKVDEYKVILFYKCNYEKPDYICLNEAAESFELNIYYNSKILDHENSDSPARNSFLNYIQTFHSEYFTMMEIYWETYNYEEKKGIMAKIFDNIFDKQNNYTFGQISHSQVNIVDQIRTVEYDDEFCLLPMIAIQMNNQLTGIHLYKRQAISIWNYLSNISALGLTIFSGLSSIFQSIYSKNFDNYKIMETILSKVGEKNSIIRLYNNKSYKALNDINLKKNLVENNDNDKDSDNDLINDKQNLKKENITNDKDEVIDEIGDLNFKLPKLSFFSFFFNNIY